MEIQGLFEIHITVDESTGYYNLWKYTFGKKDFKLILAVSENGARKEQYMISKWKNGTYEEVLERTNEIVEDMERNGVNVIRAKIESMAHNKGVPETEEDFSNFLRDNFFTGSPYFEFHAKVDTKNNSLDDFSACIEKLKKSYENTGTFVATSSNICGSGLPLITIRIYNHGRNYALDRKDKILDSLKSSGYKIIDNIQQEFSVYDTNESVDDGWLL